MVMDDIWGSYIMQYYFPNSVIYNKSSVYQDRNVQDLITNLEKEIIGYRQTYNFLNDLENRMFQVCLWFYSKKSILEDL